MYNNSRKFMFFISLLTAISIKNCLGSDFYEFDLSILDREIEIKSGKNLRYETYRVNDLKNNQNVETIQPYVFKNFRDIEEEYDINDGIECDINDSKKQVLDDQEEEKVPKEQQKQPKEKVFKKTEVVYYKTREELLEAIKNKITYMKQLKRVNSPDGTVLQAFRSINTRLNSVKEGKDGWTIVWTPWLTKVFLESVIEEPTLKPTKRTVFFVKKLIEKYNLGDTTERLFFSRKSDGKFYAIEKEDIGYINKTAFRTNNDSDINIFDVIISNIQHFNKRFHKEESYIPLKSYMTKIDKNILNKIAFDPQYQTLYIAIKALDLAYNEEVSVLLDEIAKKIECFSFLKPEVDNFIKVPTRKSYSERQKKQDCFSKIKTDRSPKNYNMIDIFGEGEAEDRKDHINNLQEYK